MSEGAADNLRHVEPGERLKADQQNLLIDLAKAAFSGDGGYFDGTGGYGRRRRSPRDGFLAIITGNAGARAATVSVGGTTNQTVTLEWAYAWNEAEWTSAGTISGITGGLAGATTASPARNIRELANNATYAWGINMAGADYPTGMRPRPIGGGGADNTHRTNTPVWMRRSIAASGEEVWWFDTVGTHDGTCE